MPDELTDHGIRTDHPDVTLIDYVDLHGDPVHVGPDHVVFADAHGYELREWADVFGVERAALAEPMHELARAVTDHNWSASDPVVFDADTFRRDGFEAIALLLRRGTSPAEAIDWVATKREGWTQSDWGEWRGRTQQAISGNVSDARQALRR